MKNPILFLFFILLSTVAFAQTRKIVLMEHFTQASCGPCASQNPAFYDGILTPNVGNICHIAYHTDWPGTDPMNAANPVPVSDRVSYYAVSGVPDVYTLGSRYNSQPGGVTQAIIDNFAQEGSPVRMVVTESTAGSIRTAHIDIKTLGTLPSGTWELRAVAVEQSVTYATAPGSNGEKSFPNVFRTFLTSTAGDPYTAAAIGSSWTVDLNYTLDPTWDADSIYVIAWLQNDATKEVIQAASTHTSLWEALNTSPTNAVAGAAGSSSSFNVNLENYGTANENYRISLSKDMPADWNATFTIAGTSYTTSHDLVINAGSTIAAIVTITPGTTPYVGEAVLSMESLDAPAFSPARVTYYAIANVRELVVNNTAGRGDGTGGSAADWEASYIDALVAASSTCHAKTNSIIASKLSASDALTEVDIIYYNVGWTFPALTDEFATQMSAYLDSGNKRMLIAGQDVVWDNFDTASGLANGTPTTKAFLETYFNVGFVSDGSTANSIFNCIDTDTDFGAVANMTINNYYGGTNFFPDELVAVAPATSFANYNSTTKVAGVKNDAGTYKTLLFGIGFEMLSTADANALMLASRNYLAAGIDLSCTVGIEETALSAINDMYPNPCDQYAFIQVNENVDATWHLQIIDATGRVIITEQAKAAGEVMPINTAMLAEGMYFYTFISAVGQTTTKALQVIH